MAVEGYTQAIQEKGTTVRQSEKLAELLLAKIEKITAGEGDSFKFAKLEDGAIKFYNTAEPENDVKPSLTINLPEEYFLDQDETRFIQEFDFEDEEFPEGTENPNLDGKPVMVLAVKGQNSKTVNYSFIDLAALSNTGKADKVKNATEGNIAILKSDGSYQDSGVSVESLKKSLRYVKDIAFAALIKSSLLTKNHLGEVYHINDDFNSTDDFIDGAGRWYTAGVDVAVILDSKGNVKFDALGTPDIPTAKDEEFALMLKNVGLLN